MIQANNSRTGAAKKLVKYRKCSHHEKKLAREKTFLFIYIVVTLLFFTDGLKILSFLSKNRIVNVKVQPSKTTPQ